MKSKVNHRQVTFAREYRGYSQTELASKIKGLSQSNLSKFEKGVGLLSEEVLQRIMSFLNFPEDFFTVRIAIDTENAHYRKRAKLTKKEIMKIENSNKLLGYVVDQMAESLEYPPLNIKTINIEDGYTPEAIAKYTRKYLGLKDEPIKDICNLLEKNGIIIIERDYETEEFDGVSFITDSGNPIIIINQTFSNDRKRFTIAHELGHLIMHNEFIIPGHRDNQKIKEMEANDFASEFLMPAAAIKNSLYGLRLTYLAELKRYWLTSMASIIRRAKNLGCISNDTYKYLNIELSRQGLRRDEKVNVYIDEPGLFKKSYKIFKNELNYADNELAEAFRLPIDIIMKFFKNDKEKSKLRVLV